WARVLLHFCQRIPVVDGAVLEVRKGVTAGDRVHTGGVAVTRVGARYVRQHPCRHQHHAGQRRHNAVDQDEESSHWWFTFWRRSIATAPAERPSVSARSSSA